MNKKNDLLIIKKDIEEMYETGVLGNLSPQQVSEILYIFANDILMNKVGETIQKQVADYYKQYAFISVVERGIGWCISYRG